MENHEPPIVLVPGFLGSDSHWDVEAIRDRYQSSRFLTTHPGPLSSHHDRACELFYSLKGGVVDYGAEHACRCDHARFGRDEGDGAFPEWDESHPIDLVGHSIGGVTARVLQQLLADGAFPGHATSAAWGPLAHNPLQPAQWRLGSLRPRCPCVAGAAPTALVAPPPASPRASVARW